MKYRVKKHWWYDIHGAEEHNVFTVQYKKRFFWHTISEYFPCGDGCITSQPKQFVHIGSAKKFIQRLKKTPDKNSFTRYYF